MRGHSLTCNYTLLPILSATCRSESVQLEKVNQIVIVEGSVEYIIYTIVMNSIELWARSPVRRSTALQRLARDVGYLNLFICKGSYRPVIDFRNHLLGISIKRYLNTKYPPSFWINFSRVLISFDETHSNQVSMYFSLRPHLSTSAVAAVGFRTATP